MMTQADTPSMTAANEATSPVDQGKAVVGERIVDALRRAGAVSPETGIGLGRLLIAAGISSVEFAQHGARIATDRGVVMPARGADGWIRRIHLCSDPALIEEAAEGALKRADRLSGAGLFWRDAAARMREDATADLEGVTA